MEIKGHDVVLERVGAVGVIRLNRPAAGNAINMQLAEGLEEATKRLVGDADVHAIILCGAGPRFCVGGDLRAFGDAGDDLPTFLGSLAHRVHETVLGLAGCSVPTIAAVQGGCAGAGVSLAAVCDFVVAERSSFFVGAYIGAGLTPDGGATFSLPRVIGERRARELLLTNRRLPADEAKQWGLVTDIVEDGGAFAAALVTAQRLAAMPRSVVTSTNELLSEGRSSSLDAQLERETIAIVQAGAVMIAAARAG